MTSEHAHAPAPASKWAVTAPDGSIRATQWPGLATLETARAPIDEDLVEIAAGMAPGKALELGCGTGQDSIWLAQRGWIVRAVDVSPGAIAEARSAAAAAAVSVVFDVADISEWRPTSRFDLVFSTFALPARGMGRGRVLDMAAAAVAPGGTILLTEFDVSLAREGWMAEKYLVSTDELERHLDGFRVNRSATRMARHRHGYEELVLPVANVIATRRSDLRTLY